MQESPQLPTTPPLSGADLVDLLNKALQTVATNFSGDIDPAALAWPYCTWADTGNGLLKRRNAAGTAWVTLGPLLSGWMPVVPSDGLPNADVGDVWVQGEGPRGWDGSAYVSLGMRLIKITRYTSSGTFTPDARTRTVEFQVQGGGGAGGGSISGGASSVGAGGGAGGYAHGTIAAASLSAPVTVTVGAGGSGVTAAAGGNGSTSSFGGVATATGGAGGANTGSSSGVFGVVGGLGGDVSYGSGVVIFSAPGTNQGQAGDSGTRGNSNFWSGSGGNTIFGAGGPGIDTGGTPGRNATGYGAGGGGAGSTTIDRAGGNGRGGIVIIKEWA